MNLRARRHTPWDPILVAGGGVGRGSTSPRGQMFMHNSWRPTDKSVKASGIARGEHPRSAPRRSSTSSCGEATAAWSVSDLTDSVGRRAGGRSPRPCRAVPDEAARHVASGAERGRERPRATCRARRTTSRSRSRRSAQAWYQQGLRAARPLGREKRAADRLLARVDRRRGGDGGDSNSWDVAWRGRDYVYLFDMNRGIEILRLKGGGAKASARMRKVSAPRMEEPGALPAGGLEPRVRRPGVSAVPVS